MENRTHQIPINGELANLNDLFMDMFTPEFLASLPPGQIETVINNLNRVEAASEVTPHEWLALKNALRERGFIE